MSSNFRGKHNETTTSTTEHGYEDTSLSPTKDQGRDGHGGGYHTGSGKKKKKSGPSDCRNEAFEDYLRTRPANRIDVIDQAKELRRQAWVNMLERREHREQEYAETMAQVGDSLINQCQ